MAQYDGSIRINTKIDSKQASAQLMTLENRIVKTADKIAGLRSKMDALGSTKIPTDAYTNIQKEITSTENKLINLYNKQERFLETGGKEGTSTYKRMSYDIEELERKLQMAQADMQNLVNTGKAFTLGSDTEKYSRLGQQLQYAENELSILNQRHQELQSKNTETESSYVRLGEAVRSAFATIGKGLVDIPIAAVKKGAQGLLTVFSKLGSVVKKSAIVPFKMMGNVAKSAFSKINQNARKSGGLLSKFGGQVKSMVSSFLIFNQIRKIFSATINSIKEGFSNLYNENSRFKSSVDSLKASVLTLKNALASAFAPIVETAIPYIQRLVEWLTKAADAVGQLLAALMGRKTYTKAVKQTATAADDAAKATKKEAEATEEAEEAAEGYLSPLDEINKYKEEEIKNSNKTTPEEIEENPAEQIGNMFEEVPISDKFKDIAQWLKNMWENADFTELGAFLGQKLKDALDNIPWEEIKETARKIGKSLATLINGFVEVEGLGESIGRTLAEAINTGFEFLNAFVHNLHWESIGKFIAETINGFFNNIDWDLIYDTFITGAKGLGDAINSFVDYLDWEAISNSISNFFNTFVDTIYEFVTTVDWKELGEKVGKTISDAWTGIDWKKAGETLGEVFKAFFDFIGTAIENVDWWAVGESVKDFLVGIDWAGVAESFFEAIGAAIGGLAAFLGGLIAGGVEAAKEYFQDKIEEAGGNVVLGILKGIGDALIGIGEWIYEHILTPLFNGFKAALGIHSPSTVMQEIGVYIIQGLLNGINSLVETVKETWESMKQTAIDAWNTVKETVIGIWQNLSQTASEVWEGIKQFFAETWENIKTTVSETWENITAFLQEKWEYIKETVTTVFENIKTFLHETWEAIKEKIVEVWNNITQKVSGAIQSIREKISGTMNRVKEIWSGAWNGMKEKVTSIIDGVKNTIQSAFDWISEKVSAIGEKLGSIGSKVKSLFSGGLFGGGLFSTSSYSSTTYSRMALPEYRNPAFATLSKTPIPALAKGAVIPANKEFLAVLGDQKHGTNVEAPLDTIRQASEEAVLNVLSKLGVMSGGNRGGTPVNLTLQVVLDRKVLGQSMVDWGKLQQMATGNNPYGLGTI